MAEQVLPTIQDSGPLPLPKFEEGLGAALIQLYSGSGASASPSSTSTTPSVITKVNSGIGGGPARISSSGGSNNNNNNNNTNSGSASNNSSSSNVLISHPNFKMGIGRRESPLDLSVKTVRQSADSSTSSLVGIDGLSNNVGSNSGSVMNRSMSASRSSTPNPQNSVANHMGGRDSGGSANSVIAAPANSTTSSVKDFPGTTPPSVIADGGKLAGSSASSTTGGDNSGRKSKKNSSGVASANTVSTNTISSNVSSNQTNGISSPGTSNLNSSHHLFGHHSVHQPHSIHAMHASPRPVLPYTSQANHHGNHSGPSGTSVNIPSSSLVSHHSIQSPIQHQQAGQPQRPSSVIPPYHPHPPNVAPPMSPYHHQYNPPASHHYHHGYNPQYYPHFQTHPPNASSHPVGSTNGPPSQTHLNYFSPYSPHGPTPSSSQGQPATPTSVPSTTQRDLNQPGSHSSSNNSSGQSQAAPVSSTASIQPHAQMNYPTSKSIPPPMTSHYTPNSAAATQSPHSAYGAYAHSMTAPALSSHPGQHPGQYYPPGVQTPRPQLEPSLSAQNLHQPHYSSHPNHASHHYSQPFGHYPPQGYGYHHPHNPNNVLPSHIPQNIVPSNQNPTKVPPPTTPVHGYGDRNTPKSLPSAHNSASTPGHPNLPGVTPAKPSSSGPEPDRNVPSKGPNSNPLNSTKPNGGTVSAPNSAAPQVPSGKTKSGGSRGSGGREGKTSSRKNLLNILRNSCESRIHEKQEKEKFQFHHQTWNFQGRKFNTVLPPAGGSSGGSSNSSSVNHHSLGLNVAEGKNNLASSSPLSSVSVSSTAKIGSAADPTSSSASLHMKTERDSFQFSAFNAEALSGGDASSSFHTLNRIRTKAEKKQLFPNLLSQIEQENSSREKASKSKNAGGNAGSRIGSHAGRGNDKAAVSVFDFEDDDEDKTTVKPAKAAKKSPAKGKGSSKKENAGSLSPTKSVTKDDSTTPVAVSKPNSQTGTPLTTLTSSAVNVALSAGASETASVSLPALSQSEVKASDAADGFWAVCDSFLTDLASNPTTIKSRRGGLWQKLKSKSNPSKTAKSPASKVKRALKNSSEEDSDFKVEEEEEKSEDKSDDTSTEDDDDNSLKSSASADSKASNSKDSDEAPIVNRKRKQSRAIRDEDDSRDSSIKDTKNASKRRKLSPSAVSSPRKSTNNRKSGSGNNNNKSRAGRSNDRKNKSPISKTRRSSRRSGRNSGRDLSMSDLDNENNSDRTSIASENSDESDSSHSFSIDSYNSESENSNSSSGSDDSESYSDSDDDESDSDINSQSSSSGRKRRRAAAKGNKKKVLRSSTKSLRSSTKRSATSKNKKARDKKKKKSKALRLKRKSLRKRNLRNLNLRPKRNCTPGSKGRLKDISGESEEEVQNEGSSGEEWIMRGELGKKKRRIVFGDGSDFNNPNWEEELIDYKKNLRMPSKLIRVPKPSSLTTSVIGGNSSTASSICNSKDVDGDVSKHENVSKQTEKGADPKKKSKAKVVKTPTKSETKSSPATTPSKFKGKSKEEKPLADAGIVVAEEKGVKLRDKSLREKPKTPEKPSNKTTNKKESFEKETKKSVPEPSTGKSTSGDRYAKLAKEKEAQMLPTPGASGSKFTKKMSIKSVFGVDIIAPPIEADKSTNPMTATETQNGTPAPTESPAPVPPKKISRRNKFKSGFDYIRKKKKVTATPDGTVAPVIPKRVKTIEKELNEEDVVAEMRGWVLRKELGETILHRAARLGYPDVASYCLEHDLVSPNSKDNAGYTPLHETCIKGNLDVAKVILAYGANPSQAAPGGIRPLHEACENGHVELVRLLISYGADPLLATYAGQSPIELAEPHEAVRLLLQEHIKDLQGKQETPWVFRGSGPWADSPYDNGYEITDCAPSPEEPIDPDAFEFEASENCLPPLYRLKGEVSFYILLQDLLNYLGQPKDRFMKNNPNADVVELNSNDFLEQAHCCHLLGEKFNLNSSSDLLTLIKYDDHVKKMLNIESCFIK